MSNTLKIVHSAPEVDPLVALREERAAVARTLAQVSNKAEKMRSAENGERAATIAIADLGAAELLAMQDWLSSGSSDQAPRPDMEKRVSLNHRLAEAMALAATMRAAAAGVDAEQLEASRNLAELDDRIERAALEILLRKYEGELADLVKLGVETQTRVAKTFGALEFFKETARSHQARGLTAKATPIFSALERLASAEMPEFAPTVKATSEAASIWGERYRELTKR